MLLLETNSLAKVKAKRAVVGPYVGRLLTPSWYSHAAATTASGIPWAADNEGFGGIDVGAFLKMLGTIAGQPNCLFVTAPDVLGDADATLRQFRKWEPIITDAGLPVAYVLQDGLEGSGVPWDLCAAVFIGGSTEFKLGGHVEQVVSEARRRGKWVHMGRVNTLTRLEYAASLGCDSVDGTSWPKYRDKYLHYLHILPYHQQRWSATAGPDRLMLEER